MIRPILVGGNTYKVTIMMHMEAVVIVDNAINQENAKLIAKSKLCSGSLDGFELSDKPSSYDVVRVERV